MPRWKWGKPGMTLAQVFYACLKQNANEAGCWEWLANRNGWGYGVLTYDNKTYRAHRLSWDLHNIPLPDNTGRVRKKQVCVLHACSNRWCVNPDHLYLGTIATAQAEKARKGRSSSTRKSDDQPCPHGHTGNFKRYWKHPKRRKRPIHVRLCLDCHPQKVGKALSRRSKFASTKDHTAGTAGDRMRACQPTCSLLLSNFLIGSTRA